MKYMYKILIDTSVWLELARDPRQTPLLEVLDNIIKRGLVTLIVPRTVLDEFRKNKDRIAKESAKSLSTHFKLVRDAVGKIGGDKRRVRSVLAYLEDVDHKIPIIGGAIEILDRIEELLTGSNVIEPTESVKLRAAQRALEKRAPFHRGKNSIADAIIIETYADCISIEIDSWVRFAFITHNKIDFSIENGDHKIPLHFTFSVWRRRFIVFLPH